MKKMDARMYNILRWFALLLIPIGVFLAVYLTYNALPKTKAKKFVNVYGDEIKNCVQEGKELQKFEVKLQKEFSFEDSKIYEFLLQHRNGLEFYGCFYDNKGVLTDFFEEMGAEITYENGTKEWSWRIGASIESSKGTIEEIAPNWYYFTISIKQGYRANM